MRKHEKAAKMYDAMKKGTLSRVTEVQLLRPSKLGEVFPLRKSEREIVPEEKKRLQAIEKEIREKREIYCLCPEGPDSTRVVVDRMEGRGRQIFSPSQKKRD